MLYSRSSHSPAPESWSWGTRFWRRSELAFLKTIPIGYFWRRGPSTWWRWLTRSQTWIQGIINNWKKKIMRNVKDFFKIRKVVTCCKQKMWLIKKIKQHTFAHAPSASLSWDHAQKAEAMRLWLAFTAQHAHRFLVSIEFLTFVWHAPDY